MKCKKNKFKYKIPPYSSILYAVVRSKLYDMQLSRIPVDELMSMDFDVSGLPRYFAAINENFIIWPKPSEACKIIIRYAPPIMEF